MYSKTQSFNAHVYFSVCVLFMIGPNHRQFPQYHFNGYLSLAIYLRIAPPVYDGHLPHLVAMYRSTKYGCWCVGKPSNWHRNPWWWAGSEVISVIGLDWWDHYNGLEWQASEMPTVACHGLPSLHPYSCITNQGQPSLAACSSLSLQPPTNNQQGPPPTKAPCTQRRKRKISITAVINSIGINKCFWNLHILIWPISA